MLSGRVVRCPFPARDEPWQREAAQVIGRECLLAEAGGYSGRRLDQAATMKHAGRGGSRHRESPSRCILA